MPASLAFLARRFDTAEPIRVTIAGRNVAAVEPAAVPDADGLPFVSPGFFDIQVNGWGGVWFGRSGTTPNDVRRVVLGFPAHGVTRLFPTLITASFESLRDGFAAVAAACEADPAVADLVPGCHLEGPYISAADGPRGAHPRAHVRPADWDEFRRLQDAAGGRIRLVTLAPEVPGAIGFIGRAVAAGVVVAVGHTAATPEDVRAAAGAGATLSTHLGNGAAATLPRHPNHLWEQLADDRLAASVIADGFHLPASVLKTILRTKPPGRAILTCDASGDAGRPPGVYGDVEILADGRIVVAGQRTFLAGSGVATDACVSGVMRLAGVPLADAVRMATDAPARLMNVEPIRLEAGSRADLVLFRMTDGGLDMTATLVAGQPAWNAAGLQPRGFGFLIPSPNDSAR